MSGPNPRAAAVAALVRQEQDGFSNLILDAELRRQKLEGRDKAFASAIFYTVLEHQGTLDYILSQFLPKGLAKLDPQVREILRAALAQGGGEDLLPPPVWGYIRREHLYGTHTDLTHLTPEELRPIALSYLKPKRMPHVLGTEQEAVRLTRRYGGDETQARIAALLHDCTKKLELPEQLALCKQYGIELDALEQRALKLLHSKTGAAIARSVFGVEDAVYDAIWYHTTGKPDMTRLEKILYLADYIEPSRDFPGVEELRKAVYEDLDHGLLLGLSMTIQEMEEMGNPVHHQTRDARDYLLKRGIR